MKIDSVMMVCGASGSIAASLTVTSRPFARNVNRSAMWFSTALLASAQRGAELAVDRDGPSHTGVTFSPMKRNRSEHWWVEPVAGESKIESGGVPE
jgi:hypothetical protein